MTARHMTSATEQLALSARAISSRYQLALICPPHRAQRATTARLDGKRRATPRTPPQHATGQHALHAPSLHAPSLLTLCLHAPTARCAFACLITCRLARLLFSIRLPASILHASACSPGLFASAARAPLPARSVGSCCPKSSTVFRSHKLPPAQQAARLTPDNSLRQHTASSPRRSPCQLALPPPGHHATLTCDERYSQYSQKYSQTPSFSKVNQD